MKEFLNTITEYRFVFGILLLILSNVPTIILGILVTLRVKNSDNIALSEALAEEKLSAINSLYNESSEDSPHINIDMDDLNDDL